MKQHIIIAVLVLSALIANGQDPNYARGLGFKTLFLDYQSQNGGNLETFKDYHHGFEISFLQKISKGLYANFPVKYGTVETYDINRETLNREKHKQIVSLDGQLQFHFHNGGNNIVPYLMAGVGGVMEFDGEFNLQVPLGAGLNFRAAKNAYINIQSEYRYSFLEHRNNLQHGLGFIYLLGGKDQDSTKTDMMEMEKKMEEEKIPMVEEPKKEMTKDSDGDGIEDKLDLCPDQKGKADLNGCPDDDGDGVADFQDNCPGLKGSKEMKGCPDSDNDGVADNDDECPNLAGAVANRGCPYKSSDKSKDTDGDGIPDASDKCPDQAGKAENGGCPVTDRDMDGVDDAMDQCPDVKGSKNTGGCPDSDNDGIADPDDKCPKKAGPASLMGCPDSDGDGIGDDEDKCPNMAGPKSMGGCPDSDGDGLDDSIDKCPKAAGLKVYGGCPDTDGDGLDDSIDKCPNTPGTVASNGCPDITVEDRKTLDVAMRAVQFETGKATLKAESFVILRQISGILNRYPDYNLVIAGHTDNTGSSIANQELSEKRAKACHDYLITQGVSQSRLSYVGYGESRPVSDNATENGRSLNRRVEFNMNPR